MTETEKHPLPVVAATPDQEHLVTPNVVDEKVKKELPPELRPDPTLTFMARNVSW